MFSVFWIIFTNCNNSKISGLEKEEIEVIMNIQYIENMF